MEANPIQTREVSKLYLELMRATGTSGQAVLKTATLINGAACVAILAFLGQVLEKQLSIETIVLAKGLADSLLFFAWGVVLSTAAAGTTYLTNLFQGMNPFRFWYSCVVASILVSVLLVAGSLIVFMWGWIHCQVELQRIFRKQIPCESSRDQHSASRAVVCHPRQWGLGMRVRPEY
jgi:hypothetical protein